MEKFLSFCKANAHKISWEEGQLSIGLIEAQEARLASHADAIDAIKHRRDKRFAHSDRKYFENADQVMDDFPLEEEDFVALANCVVQIISEHRRGLKPNVGRIGAHIFNEIAVDNMVRNLESGRKINFPGQLN